MNENIVPFSKSKLLLFGKIPLLFALFTIVSSIYLPLNSFLIGFLGKYLLSIMIPMWVGAFLTIFGAKNLLNGKEISLEIRFSKTDASLRLQIQSETFIILGAILGITQILAFLPIILNSLIEFFQSRKSRKISDQTLDISVNKQKKYRYLLILPVLTSYFLLAMFIINTEDRAWIPWSWRGRFGLSLWETLWDVQLFWGEIWYNIMFILLIGAMILYKFPPNQSKLFNLSEKQEHSLFQLSFGICGGIFLLMIITAFTQNVQVDIWTNWYSTQFGYQVISWPFIIAMAGLMIFSINTSKNRNISSKIMWVCLCGFSSLWIYLALISDYHPEVVLSFGIPIYYAITVVAFPMCIVVYLIQRIKTPPNLSTIPNIPSVNDPDEPIQIFNRRSERSLYLWLPLVLFTAGTIIGLQFFKAGLISPVISGSMWDFEMDWYIGFCHWPIWAFDIAAIFTLIFGSRMYYNLRNKTGGTQKSNQNEKNSRKINVIHWKSQKIRTGAQALTMIGLVTAMVFIPLVTAQSQWNELDPPVLLINQVGYMPDSPKKLLYQVPSNISATYYDDLPNTISFEIVNQSNKVIMSVGNLTKLTERYGHKYMIGYFDNLTVQGEYFARININHQEITSYSFEINSNVYEDVIELCLRFFYYQRCNYQVEEVVLGYPGHDACHMNDAEVWDGSKWVQINLHGGWHDAGDYNKYNSWFQTQWYCTQALMEGYLLDPQSAYSSVSSLYDTSLPDVVDEALWGLQFLINSINQEGILGEENRSRIWRTVSGYRHFNAREGRMSYSGLPEYDWSTPRRVVPENGESFTGPGQGFNFAGTIMQAARMIDEIKTQYPNVELPNWVPTNTTELRQIASEVYQKDLELQGTAPDDNLGLLTGKLLYAEEMGRVFGNNWSMIDMIINQSLPLITEQENWAFWFGWVGYYQLGNILTHYISNNRTVPLNVMNKVLSVQSNHFSNLFDLPFQVKHSIVNNTEVLFYGVEKQTDLMTSVWLQTLIAQVNSSIANPSIIQSYLDWLFGLNPANICIMEGVGDKNYPQYHNRIQSAKNPRGAIPGAIPNGFSLKPVSVTFLKSLSITSNDESVRQTAYVNYVADEGCIATWSGNPYWKHGVPSSSNEIWIPHNAMMLRIMTSMEQSGLFR